jgi:hypothetical protein
MQQVKTDKQTAIENAVYEAERFIIAARKSVARFKADSFSSIVGNRETAQCKRASLDLSNALADMRRAK